MTHEINRGARKDGHPIARAEAFAAKEREASVIEEKITEALAIKPKVKSAPKRKVAAKKRVVRKAKK